ncbi:uncharacterized protein V1516DRAFT_95950 [Lipomyces oligophaga]|uniref:uncharacterized protein n=1 Tax=Lipomyces oligophaga TaxID=45792 RepID=UPI0034CE8FD0
MFRSSFLALVAALVATSSVVRVAAHAVILDVREVSTDTSCGGENGWTCPDAQCCSASGWCGTSTDYCDTGCQALYGVCNNSTTTAPTGLTADDGSCGASNFGFVCADGQCCSEAGWCGTSTDYCSTGCQTGYGVCESDSDSGDTDTDPTTESPDGSCGPTNGYICTDDQCCSPSGWCGNSTDYCAAPDCLVGYGRCDADMTPSGLNTSTIARTLLGDLPYGEFIIDCNDPGHVAITYDDGPYEYTEDLLTILRENHVKATFFIVGNNLGKGPIDEDWRDVIEKMSEDGHQIASHSWSHANFSSLTKTEMRAELVKNEMALNNILGKFPTYFRPPYSQCNDDCLEVLEEMGYHAILFDLDTEDYLHTTDALAPLSRAIVREWFAEQDVKTDDTLAIMHDIHNQTVYHLTGYFLQVLKRTGYKTVTVGECLGDDAANWYRST